MLYTELLTKLMWAGSYKKAKINLVKAAKATEGSFIYICKVFFHLKVTKNRSKGAFNFITPAFEKS